MGNVSKPLQKAVVVSGLVLSAIIGTSSTVQAGLIDRGNGMIYDDVLDITWLQDANYAQTSNHSQIDTFGQMAWEDAEDWVQNLEYGGFTDWRLPDITITSSDGKCTNTFSGGECGYNVDTSQSELAHMFYVNLGNLAFYREDGSSRGPQYESVSFIDALTGEKVSFFNLASEHHWSDESYIDDTTGNSWYFHFDNGLQSRKSNSSGAAAWAVRDGDVIAATRIPEPATLAIFCLGLAYLGYRRSKSA